MWEDFWNFNQSKHIIGQAAIINFWMKQKSNKMFRTTWIIFVQSFVLFGLWVCEKKIKISWLKNPVAMIYCIEVENWRDTYFKHVKVETFLSHEQILVKMIILWNHWTIWKQTKQVCSLEDPVYCIDLKTKTATILTGTYAKLKKKKISQTMKFDWIPYNFFFLFLCGLDIV